MTIWEGLLRFLLGGSLVLVIGIIAKNGKSTAAGIVALFPAITAVSFMFMTKSVDISAVRASLLTAVASLPATLVFLLAFYFCVSRMNLILTLTISLACWLAAAALVYYFRH